MSLSLVKEYLEQKSSRKAYSGRTRLFECISLNGRSAQEGGRGPSPELEGIGSNSSAIYSQSNQTGNVVLQFILVRYAMRIGKYISVDTVILKI